MTETPREPDRFDSRGQEVADQWGPEDPHLGPLIAAALRAAYAEALERAVEIARIERNAQASLNAKGQPSWFHRGALAAFDNVLGKLRALIPPAAAPAAEPRLDNLAAESPAPVAETGKEKGAEALTRCIAGQRETLHAAGKRIAELEGSLRGAYRQNAKPPGDWACAECRPGSDLVAKGFRCWWHVGESLARAAQTEGEGT